MAAITVTAISVAFQAPQALPSVVGVTSSGAAAIFNFNTSLWKILSMVTT